MILHIRTVESSWQSVSALGVIYSRCLMSAVMAVSTFTSFPNEAYYLLYAALVVSSAALLGFSSVPLVFSATLLCILGSIGLFSPIAFFDHSTPPTL